MLGTKVDVSLHGRLMKMPGVKGQSCHLCIFNLFSWHMGRFLVRAMTRITLFLFRQTKKKQSFKTGSNHRQPQAGS